MGRRSGRICYPVLMLLDTIIISLPHPAVNLQCYRLRGAAGTAPFPDDGRNAMP